MNVVPMLGKKLGIYLSAVLVAYVLAVAMATQHVVGRLASIGVSVSPAGRITMTLQDFAGMAGTFLPMVAFAFLVAFLVTALLHYGLRRWRVALYTLAGGVALVTIHLALSMALGLTPVAIARSTGGLALQGLAGAAGGLLYIVLTLRFESDRS